jgi:pilus assembly protein CpaB
MSLNLNRPIRYQDVRKPPMRRTKAIYALLVLLLLLIVLVGGYLFLSFQSQAADSGQTEILPGIAAAPTVLPKVRVLVANQPIPANTMLTAELVSQWFTAQERERTPDIGEDVIGSERQLVDHVTLMEIQPEQLLYTTQFTPATLAHKIPSGERAVPLKVDRFSGVVGLVTAGNYVDIVFSGQIEMHYPQAFPASPEEPPAFLSPVSLLAVKTILQDVQVLQVIPITSSAGLGMQPTPTPSEGGAALETMPPGEWILILAVNDQEAEVLRFAQDQGMTYQLLLRAPEDHAAVTTQGITTKLLVQSYGVPMPEQLGYEITPGQLPSGVIP